MERLPMRLQTHRGDAFTLDFSICNNRKNPLVVSIEDVNPYLVYIVTSARYKQKGDFKQIYWVDLKDMPKFKNIQALYIPDFSISAVTTRYSDIEEGDVSNYLFYTINAGKKIYKYLYEATDNEEIWEEYNFHILQTFDTTKWIEQTYILQIKYVTGQTLRERVTSILGDNYDYSKSLGQNIENITDETIRDKCLICLVENKPLYMITEERTILSATYIDVASNQLSKEDTELDIGQIDLADPVLIEKTITENGTYNASDDSADGYSKVEVSAPVNALPDVVDGSATVITADDLAGATMIRSGVFRDYSGLTSVTIPDSVTSIGASAFYGCSGLTEITIPDSVTSIEDNAFYNCSGLTSVTLGNGVISIGSFALSACTKLTSITIPDSVISIGSQAFYGCTGLISITIPDSVMSIGDWAFSGCSALPSIIIPDSVTSIGQYVFYGCSALTSITIPGSVTSIGNYAFRDCSALTSITIPGSVTSIGSYTFRDCSKLTSITIPGSVTSIGSYTFYGCSKLTSIVIESVTPPTLANSNSFTNTNNCPIYVPAASVDAYKTTTNWSVLASRIQAIPS